MKKIANAVIYLLVTLLVVIAIVSVALKALGGGIYVIETGSMEPSYKPGDAVFVVPQKSLESYSVGDVITARTLVDSEDLVTHRIVEIHSESNSLRTKGDANNVIDKELNARNLVGKVEAKIPYLGYGIDGLKKNLVLWILILFVFLLSFTLLTSSNRRTDNEKRENSNS